MLCPNVPEFVPRGMQPTVPSGEYKQTVPPVDERPCTSQSSGHRIRAERREEDGRRNRAQNPPLLEQDRRGLKESYGSKKPGGTNRSRNGAYNSYTRNRDSLRSYDNWRQRVDENLPDRQGSNFKSMRRPSEEEPEEEGSKSKFQQGRQRPWRQKGEIQEKENVTNREGKKGVGRGKSLPQGPTHAIETQSPSYRKPGLSYGKILAGDFAWGGKDVQAGNGDTHLRNSNDLGLISNPQHDEQWPSLLGSHTRSLTKEERTEVEVQRGQVTSLVHGGTNMDSKKSPKIEKEKECRKEGGEVTRVEREDISKWMSNDEKKFAEKGVRTRPENATESKRSDDIVKEGHIGQVNNSMNLRPAIREKEKNHTDKVKVKETNKKQSEEKEGDGNFEWQVKRDRRKQAKPQEETTKMSTLVQQQKGQKNRKGKADVNPSCSKGKSASKSENKSVNQNVKNIPHTAARSAGKLDRKVKQSSPRQQDQSARDRTGISSVADTASAERKTSELAGAQKAIAEGEESSRLKAKKLKKKEEKMKKREQQIRKAQEMMKKDSKLSMITKAFLESAYTGSGGQTSALTPTAGQSLFENFPSLAEQRSSIVKRNVKNNNVSPDIGKRGTQEDSREKKKWEDPSVSPTSQASGRAAASGVSSYSGVLLASPKREAKPKSQPTEEGQGKEARNVAVQKKKVKTKDRIELDLMCAALQSKKRKEKERSDKTFMSELHPMSEKPRRNMETHTVVKASKNAFAGHLRAKAKGTAPATTLFRGFQREGREHKHLSPLKKRMKKARLQEAETLLAIVREAKKAQERLIQESLAQSTETSVEDDRRRSLSPLLLTSSVSRAIVRDSDAMIKEKNESKDVEGCKQDGSSIVAEEEELRADGPNENEGEKSISKLSGDGAEQLTVAIVEPQNTTLETEITQEPQSTSDAATTPELKQDIKIPEQESTTTNKTTASTKTTTDKDIKKVLKDIRAHDVSPAKVGNLLANLDDPELAKRCSELAQEIKIMAHPLHKMSFREYCDHVITPEVDSAVKTLVTMLVKFQERQYQRDPIKAKIRRRYVCGLKEATKLMTKMSCVIVAPDIQRSRGPGLLDEVVTKMLNRARECGVPLIFALSLKMLGRLCHKSVPVSCIGIINYQGAQDVFSQLMELVPAAKAKYQTLVNTGMCTVPAEAEGLSDEEKEPEDPPQKML